MSRSASLSSTDPLAVRCQPDPGRQRHPDRRSGSGGRERLHRLALRQTRPDDGPVRPGRHGRILQSLRPLNRVRADGRGCNRFSDHGARHGHRPLPRPGEIDLRRTTARVRRVGRHPAKGRIPDLCLADIKDEATYRKILMQFGSKFPDLCARRRTSSAAAAFLPDDGSLEGGRHRDRRRSSVRTASACATTIGSRDPELGRSWARWSHRAGRAGRADAGRRGQGGLRRAGAGRERRGGA